MSFVDRMHRAGFGVILDFAPVHFASDDFALRQFDGTCLYEYSGEHEISPWGSPQFDLGKDPVRAFLMSAMNYFLCYFHFDGIRCDAVSNIVFWDGNKAKGENTGATEFIRRLNGKIHAEHPSVMMIAEDSTDFTKVTHPVEYGGLGFDYKWDLGWMNDTLKYYSKDPIYKKYEHNKPDVLDGLFLQRELPSPAQPRRSGPRQGDDHQQDVRRLRHEVRLGPQPLRLPIRPPGKKLNFMGNELASFDEWNENKSLPWDYLRYPKHDSVRRMVRDLNLIYRSEEAMHVEEHNPERFRWLMVDNADQSVFAFERKYGESDLIFVFNMTPNYYGDYVIGTYEPGTYVEIFNSDKDVYGGYNQYNGLPAVSAVGAGPENRPCHMRIEKIASFGAMIFKRALEKSEAKKEEAAPSPSKAAKKTPAPSAKKKARRKRKRRRRRKPRAKPTTKGRYPHV